MKYSYNESFALEMDARDALKKFKKEYILPQHEGEDMVYFVGNSLGLQPKKAAQYIDDELVKWAKQGVEGHFEAPRPWLNYHMLFKKSSAHLVGALEHEVVVMNNLTTNLHLLMSSFYRPEGKRFKILMEAGSFPSDAYAVESQVKLHGHSANDAIIEIKPKKDAFTLETADILEAIESHKDEIALILLPGIQYYTGQVMPMQEVAGLAGSLEIPLGLDLAHAAGNIPMHLHDWGVDFAVWCTYKYLNSGPGAVAGAFVHERHADNPDLPRLAGWWGHDEASRFRMEKGFIPMYGADGWQLSNMNILGTAAHLAAAELFLQADIRQLRRKSIALTGYLAYLIETLDNGRNIQIITPSEPEQRGCQLSLLVKQKGRKLFDLLREEGVLGDWREPDVIRLAPTPMYNTFHDVYRFGKALEKALVFLA
jgi:kynureninase